MNALVIGYGSIGKRHCRLLQEQGLEKCDIYIAELQPARIEQALSSGHKIYDLSGAVIRDFDIVVVASSTASHVHVLKLLPKINKLLYIEKPIAHNFLKVAPIRPKNPLGPNKALFIFLKNTPNPTVRNSVKFVPTYSNTFISPGPKVDVKNRAIIVWKGLKFAKRRVIPNMIAAVLPIVPSNP